ncbi:MAG TPA: hypothetical protein VJR90_01040, partial [Gammaproteobacteria bacterium]|nr:hypothetical protein [Gammaproteobacteria bacterium]
AGAAPPEKPESLDDASVRDVLAAQARTADWLEQLGAHVDDPEGPPQHELDEAAAQAARAAFTSVTNPYIDPFKAKSDLMALTAPAPVRHLAGLLSHYDEAFVKEAGRIRGYIVSKLMEHAASKDAKISLAALKTLGTVTEIGAYTTRVEISRPPSESTPTALVERLRSRLNALKPPAPEVIEDATMVIPAVVSETQPELQQ